MSIKKPGVSLPLGEEKAVSSRLLIPTRIANLTRITDKMPTTKNSVVLVVDCISFQGYMHNPSSE